MHILMYRLVHQWCSSANPTRNSPRICCSGFPPKWLIKSWALNNANFGKNQAESCRSRFPAGFHCYIIDRPYCMHTSLYQRTLSEILTSISVGTQWFFLGCSQDNNRGYNFITKKKICLVHQKRKLATIEINKFLI